jgi:two-component system chemotaxis sensor kinase CheA
MDEMLKEFLAESAEQIEAATAQIVAFERNPADAALIASIFRLVHTIKGTCGFLGLSRLQHLTHAAESLIGQLREGAQATPDVVSVILAAVDRIKLMLAELEDAGQEVEGDDADLIALLDRHVQICQGAVPDEPADFAEETPLAEAEPPVLAAPAPFAVAESVPHEDAPEKTAAADAHEHAAGEPAQGKRAETIRINLNTLERIMQLVSELVLTRNQLIELTRNKEDDSLKSPLQRLSGMTSDLQDAVMRARMQPVERVFANLPRMIRDLANDLGKKINLVTEGADTELDRQLIDLIRDPLTHLVRNCADHGIESPEERVRLGKPATGVVRVAAAHEAGQITIENKRRRPGPQHRPDQGKGAGARPRFAATA